MKTITTHSLLLLSLFSFSQIMKKPSISLVLFFWALCTSLMGQVRPDLINDFSPAERTTLVNLMQQYITAQVVEDHCDYVAQGEPDIHDDFNFMPFHRAYIEGMEDFLILNGHPEFVPLPSWNPATPTPVEFRVVDSDCLLTACVNGVQPGSTPAQYCSVNVNWNPNRVRPNYLNASIQSGPNNDICDYFFQPTTPGGSSSIGLSRNIETPYHNQVHMAMGGNMGNFSGPSSPIFWCWHAYLDDMWKEWECNCPQSTTRSVDLYIKDNDSVVLNIRDRGEEPNIDNGPMWRSQDIWIRNQPDGFSNQTHENPEYSPTDPVFVYVRVRNRGCQSSLGDETLTLNWAKAGTSLSWPGNWDGSLTSPALMGNSVGTQNIPVIRPQGSTIVEFQWFPPNPADYNGINNEPFHFCLLARQVSLIDPMTSPEGANLNANVRNNNNIAWKNITVVDMMQRRQFMGSIIEIRNSTRLAANQSIEINIDQSQLFAEKMFNNNLVLKVDEKLRERFARISKNNKGLKPLNEKGEYVLTSLPIIIDGILLEKQESRQISIEFRGGEKMRFREPININVIQRTEDKRNIVGGVTYTVVTEKASEDQKKPNMELTPLTYGGKSYYNWYTTKGRIITTNSNFGYPKELNTFSKYDTSIDKFTLIQNFKSLNAKITAVRKRSFFDRIFSRKMATKGQIINAALPKKQYELKTTNFTNSKYVEIALPSEKLEGMVVMVFNPYCEIVNNYLIESGREAVSIRKDNFCVGENHIYLVSGIDVVATGNITIKVE